MNDQEALCSSSIIAIFVDSRLSCRMSSILRAANLCKQGVNGSNPVTPTNFLLSFTELN